MKQLINTIATFGIAITMFGSCQSVMEEPVAEQPLAESITETTTHSPYHITQEQALKNLDNFLNSLEPKTRGEKRTVANVMPVKYNSLRTRSESNDTTI